MGKIIRKLLLSVLSLTLSAIMLGTVTYAWITMTNKNFLDGLVLNVKLGSQLEISLDGMNYYSNLPSELLSDSFSGLKFQDVTSKNGMDFDSGGPNGSGNAYPNVDYATITLWVRTYGAERNVYLIDNVSDLVQYDIGMAGTFVVSRGIQWKADTTFVNGPNETIDIVEEGKRGTYYAADAVRISFLEQKNWGNPLDTRPIETLSRVLIDPSSDPSRGYGVPYGAIGYLSAKFGEIVEAPVDTPVTVYELTELMPNNPYIAMNEDSKIMELIESDEKNEEGQNYYVGKVVVNVWLEGWDADCFDAIYLDEVRIQLKFWAAKSNPN
jgi:hypothetical protein